MIIPKAFQEFYTPSRYKVAYGGRGSGKSWAFAHMIIRLGSIQRLTILCAREIQKSIEDSVYRLLVNIIHDNNLSGWKITKSDIIHSNGTRIFFKGLHRNISSVKSVEGIDIVWIEEAHSVSQESWDYLIPTIRKEGSEIWITFNPDSVDDPVFKMFIENERTGSIVKKINYDSNQFFPDTLKEEMEWDRAHDPDKFSWIWEGNPRTHTDAQIFRGYYRIEAFETPKDVQFLHGADWGFADDPTVGVRGFIHDNILYIDQEVYGLHVSIDHLPELFDSVHTFRKWVTIADSARPETIDYMKKRGFNIKGARKGPNSIEDGIERLKAFHGIVIHPRCKHTIDEFRLYSYKVNKHTGEITPVPEDKHNHIIDSIRYMTEKKKKRQVVAGSGRVF